MEILTGKEAKKAFYYSIGCGGNNRCHNCGEKIEEPIVVETENERYEPVQSNFCSKECAEYLTA